MNLMNRLKRFRQRTQGNYRRGNVDFNYKKALGLAEYYRIEAIVKKEYAHLRIGETKEC